MQTFGLFYLYLHGIKRNYWPMLSSDEDLSPIHAEGLTDMAVTGLTELLTRDLALIHEKSMREAE